MQICTRRLSPSDFQRQAGAAAAADAPPDPLAWQQALLVDAPCAAPGLRGATSGAETLGSPDPDLGTALAMPLGAWLRERGMRAGADGVAVRVGTPAGEGLDPRVSRPCCGGMGDARTSGHFGDVAARGAGARASWEILDPNPATSAGPRRPQSSAPPAVGQDLASYGSTAAALRRAGSSTPPRASRFVHRRAPHASKVALQARHWRMGAFGCQACDHHKVPSSVSHMYSCTVLGRLEAGYQQSCGLPKLCPVQDLISHSCA